MLKDYRRAVELARLLHGRDRRVMLARLARIALLDVVDLFVGSLPLIALGVLTSSYVRRHHGPVEIVLVVGVGAILFVFAAGLAAGMASAVRVRRAARLVDWCSEGERRADAPLPRSASPEDATELDVLIDDLAEFHEQSPEVVREALVKRMREPDVYLRVVSPPTVDPD